jgi:hypothetical protein
MKMREKTSSTPSAQNKRGVLFGMILPGCSHMPLNEKVFRTVSTVIHHNL